MNDRDLDALVDEKVMGHPQCKANHAQSGGWCMSCNPPVWVELPGGGRHGEPTPRVRAKGFWPPYSTEMQSWHGGAWDVASKAKSICIDRGSDCATYQCCYNGAIAVADTAQRAICIAALRAVGVNIDG